MNGIGVSAAWLPLQHVSVRFLPCKRLPSLGPSLWPQTPPSVTCSHTRYPGTLCPYPVLLSFTSLGLPFQNTDLVPDTSWFLRWLLCTSLVQLLPQPLPPSTDPGLQPHPPLPSPAPAQTLSVKPPAFSLVFLAHSPCPSALIHTWSLARMGVSESAPLLSEHLFPTSAVRPVTFSCHCLDT